MVAATSHHLAPQPLPSTTPNEQQVNNDPLLSSTGVNDTLLRAACFVSRLADACTDVPCHLFLAQIGGSHCLHGPILCSVVPNTPTKAFPRARSSPEQEPLPRRRCPSQPFQLAVLL